MTFFVHTCLVLMWSAERLRLDGRQLFAAFYVRRLFRIYPLSIFCVLAVYCLSHRWWNIGPLCHPGPMTPARLWMNITLTQGLFRSVPTSLPWTIVPLWSLPLEVQMYILLPALFIVLRNRPMWWVFGVWVLSVFVALAQPWLGDRFLGFLYAPCFLGGVIAWRFAKTYHGPRLPGWLWPPALLAVSMIWMAATPRYVDCCRNAFGLFLGFSIPLFGEIPWNFVKTTSRLVAKYSYGIYLSHFPILMIVLLRLPHHGRLTRCSTLILLFLAIPLLLYHGVEAPGIHYGKRLADWITRKVAMKAVKSPVPDDESLGGPLPPEIPPKLANDGASKVQAAYE